MHKLLLPILLTLMTSGAAALAQSPPPGDAVNGKRVYVADGCYQCHGYVGQGSRPTGPHLAPKPVPYEGFAAQVRHPVNTMPPYTTVVLSDQELADIYAWLQSIPKPADYKSIPLLNQ